MSKESLWCLVVRAAVFRSWNASGVTVCFQHIDFDCSVLVLQKLRERDMCDCTRLEDRTPTFSVFPKHICKPEVVGKTQAIGSRTGALT